MTIVRTHSGLLRGTRRDHDFYFGAIPYATAPTGPNRFRLPQPVRAWDGERPAVAPGPAAPQVPVYGVIGEVFGTRLTRGEDCLNLSVRTPTLAADRLPVLVWLHGGGFAVGSGDDPAYQGGAFARSGIVEVTVNYRLGAAGFALLGNTANLGLHDQLAALTWVRENIGAFGGDPDRVTVAGHSSGAMSLGCLLAAPHGRGLIDRAIIQSPMAPLAIDFDSARGIAAHLADELGVDLAAIATVPGNRLLDAQQTLCAQAATGEHPEWFGAATQLRMAFVPVVDGDLIPIDPLDALAGGAAAGIPVLGGHTRDEAMLQLDHAFGGTEPAPEFADFLIAQLIQGTGLPVDRVRATYRGARPEASELRLTAAVVSDLSFALPTQSVIGACAAHAPTYAYRFDYPAIRDGKVLGAMHGAELPYVFADTTTDLARSLTSEPDSTLVEQVHRLWSTFITDGTPAHPDLPEWPLHTRDRRATMLLDAPTCRVQDDPSHTERTLWETRCAG